MTDYFTGDPRTNRERMLAGDLYIADDPENARLARRGARLAVADHRAAVEDESPARPLLAELLGELGDGAFAGPPLFVDHGENIRLGARGFVNDNPTALDVAPVTIGGDVRLGGGVIVCPGATIRDDSVVGAGSAVTRDIPAGVVAVGDPARVLREIGAGDALR